MAMYPCLSLPSLTFPTLTDSIVTFNSQYAGLPLKSHSVEVVATKSGSGTPSPSNPRPISGVDSIHIQNTAGINQWDEVWELGGISDTTGEDVSGSNRIRSKNYIRVLPNETYYIKTPEGFTLYPFYYDADKNFIVQGSGKQNTTVLLGSNVYYIRFFLYKSGWTDPTYNNDISINYPSTDTSYHAFNGQSFTIQIGSTVYGGEYDARTGVFTVTDKIINLGNLSWSASGSNFVSPYFNLTDTNIKPPATNNDVLNGMCEVLNLTSYNSLSDKCIALSSGKNLFARNSDYIDATDFKNSVTGYYLKYPLATRTTIQLPPCPIDTLLGENNIWADTGDTTLQYPKFG